jgi:hypothetical protein
MRFFLSNFLVTLGAYGLTTFVYPVEATVVPRICFMWSAPMLGTMAALFLTRVFLPWPALGAEALALVFVTGIYCLLYHQTTLIDTLQYVTVAYFLPGAIPALLVGLFAKHLLKLNKR